MTFLIFQKCKKIEEIMPELRRKTNTSFNLKSLIPMMFRYSFNILEHSKRSLQTIWDFNGYRFFCKKVANSLGIVHRLCAFLIMILILKFCYCQDENPCLLLLFQLFTVWHQKTVYRTEFLFYKCPRF